MIQLAAVLLVASSVLAAQTTGKRPAFEVASIRPANPNADGSTWNTDPGRFTARNWTLRQYIMIAYDLTEPQVSGGPKWLDADRYDITATLEPTDHPPKGKEIDMQMRAACQVLLAERFKLEVHRETRLTTGYLLLAARHGPKLKEAAAGGRNSNSWKRGKLTSTRVSMDKLADVLSRILLSPVANQTGIQGVYDVTLEWVPEDSRPDDTTSGPSIFTSLQEQLGLRLEAVKTAQDVIVIDRVEKPTEN